jgi:hypothetical protein
VTGVLGLTLVFLLWILEQYTSWAAANYRRLLCRYDQLSWLRGHQYVASPFLSTESSYQRKTPWERLHSGERLQLGLWL